MKRVKKILILFIIFLIAFITSVFAIIFEDSSKFKSGLLYNYLDNSNVFLVSPKANNQLSYSEVQTIFSNNYNQVIQIKDKNNNILPTSTTNIPTGSIVIGKNSQEFKTVLYGDSNGDGIICSSADVDVIKNDYLDIQKSSGVYKLAADLCTDSKLNVKDIQRMLLKQKNKLNTGLVDNFPDEGTYYASFKADNVLVEKIKFSVGYGLIKDEPVIPDKAGYTKKWENYQLKKQDITVNAVYTPIEYTITYEKNGGNFVGTAKSKYTVEDTDKTLPIPEKENKVFEGWYENSDFSGNKVENLNGLTKN